MTQTTPRTALRYPELSEAPAAHTQLQALAEDLENKALPLAGVSGSIPSASASRAGRTYVETNTGKIKITDHVAWREIPKVPDDILGVWHPFPVGSNNGHILTDGTPRGIGTDLWSGLFSGEEDYYSPSDSPLGTSQNGNYQYSTITGPSCVRSITMMNMVAAEHAVTGRTAKIRVKVQHYVGSTAPGVTFTAGLHRVTGVGGDANGLSISWNTTPVCSAAISTGALGLGVALGTAISMPADGLYVLASKASSMPSASASSYLYAAVQRRYV